jgi:F0F1-type ATP synthase assembly protein I
LQRSISLLRNARSRYNRKVCFRPFSRARKPRNPVTALVPSRPFRVVLQWQAIVTVALAVFAGLWAGWNGAWSALLGGAVSLVASVVFMATLGLSLGDGRPAGPVKPLRAMLRAEAAKVMAIVGGLVLALKTFDDIVHPVFFGAFIVAVIVFSMAFFVADQEPGNTRHG